MGLDLVWNIERNHMINGKLIMGLVVLIAFSACAGQSHKVVVVPVIAPTIPTTELNFRFDSDELLTKYMPTLKDLVAYQKNHPQTAIVIEGHTDQWGTEPYNDELGDRRARIVKAYIIQQGVPADKIVTITYGKDKPKQGESDPNKNRRVVIKDMNQ